MADYLLDTNVLARCLRGLEPTLDLARTLAEEGDLHVSVLSHLELLTLARAKDERRTLEFLGPFILHPVSELIAGRAALLLRRNEAAQPNLNLSEAVIAATALQHGLTVVTFSPGELNRVNSLKIYPLPAVAGSGRSFDKRRGES